MSDITKKLATGAIWNTISQFGGQAINFVITLILAWLLSPKDFGLIGMVGVITYFLGYFTEFGLTPSLIQKKEVDELDENTVFWATCGFSIVWLVIVFFLAPLVAMFYKMPELTLITRVIFLSFLFAPLSFVPEALEIKKLNYNRIATANLLSDFLSGVTAIILAFSGFGVWSLVCQAIVKPIVRSSFFLIKTSWRPKFLFSIERFKSLFSFGLHFTVKNLLLFVTENVDYLMVGKLLGPYYLGIYTLAFRISKYPVMKVWGIIGQMLFPAFSKFHDDIERVKRNYLKVIVFTGTILLPALACIFFGIDSFVLMFLKEKWMPIVPIVKIFVIYLLLFSYLIPDDPVLSAIGKVKLVNINKLIFTILLLISGYLGISFYGLTGIAWAYVLSYVVSGYFLKVVVLPKININMYEILGALKKSAASGLIVWFGCLLIYVVVSVSLLQLVLLGMFAAITMLSVFVKKDVISIKDKKIKIENIV